MDPLTELAIKYGTDKWGKHNYTPVYYELFKDRRNEVKNVVEIGVAEGASLFMWRDFFPKATIEGVDNDNERLKKLRGLDRISTGWFDQRLPLTYEDHSFIEFQKADLIIDDGSHRPEDQLLSCFSIMIHTKKDVIYVIEDVVDEEISKYIGNLYSVEIKKVGKRYDDKLIIVRHKNG